jgi:hypothetical protein
MILRVPVIVGNTADWARKVASAINQLIAGQDAIASGPYADDAAAGEGGIGVGGLYRRPDGTVWWRQAP